MTVPETPTVALYDYPTFIAEEEETLLYLAEVPDTESEEDKAEKFFRSLDPPSPLKTMTSPTISSFASSQKGNRKRPAELDLIGPSSNEVPVKKRRTSITEDDLCYSSSNSSIMTDTGNSEKHNATRLHIPVSVQMHPDTWITQENSGRDVDVFEWSPDPASDTTSQTPASSEALGVDLEMNTGQYDEEELETAYPVLMREYDSARADLARTSKAHTDYARAAERFDRAKSQLKAVLNEESVAKSAEVRDVAAAQDAFEAETNIGLWEQQQPASTLSGPNGRGNPYHPHHSAQPRPDPTKIKKHGGQFPPKPKFGGQQQRPAAKSVRFELQRGGPNDVMRQEAKRAVGRYTLTSMRRGSLGPYR
jgi:hypothetical protein